MRNDLTRLAGHMGALEDSADHQPLSDKPAFSSTLAERAGLLLFQEWIAPHTTAVSMPGRIVRSLTAFCWLFILLVDTCQGSDGAGQSLPGRWSLSAGGAAFTELRLPLFLGFFFFLAACGMDRVKPP